ncbi:MAG: SLBB domain-containing protein [Candidatus Izemoplasmatales bacterium]
MKKYLGYGIIVISLIGFFYFNNKTEETTSVYQPYEEVNTNFTNRVEEKYYVEIRGEVRFPNVYEVGEFEILKTLIDKAGGLTENADISEINQAALVEKNSLIIIPSIIKDDFFDDVNTTTVPTEKYIYVDIKGEVNNPGVYWVKLGTRVFEMIEISGGVTDQADLTNINMSEAVSDGVMINIPKLIEPQRIYAYISGAVVNPGYYFLDEDPVLSDLIIAAGGLSSDADETLINFNQQIADGDKIIIEEKLVTNKIYVSIKGEVVNPNVYYVDETISIVDLIYLAGGLTEEADAGKINYNQVLVLGSVVVIPVITVDDYQPIENDSDLVNINLASLDELQTLKGIGEILGQRIIDYRNEFGYFQSIEDIQFVSGIKSSIYEDIKEFITVG